MRPTYELMRACIPTRDEKRRIARALGYSDESMVYKWCEDPEGSGRPNPIDHLDVILDHARVHHPDAALEVEQHFEAANYQALGMRAARVRGPELIAQLQPASEKEALEAVRAFSAYMRSVLVSGNADLSVVIREVEEAERQMKAAAVMLRAAHAAISAEQQET